MSRKTSGERVGSMRSEMAGLPAGTGSSATGGQPTTMQARRREAPHGRAFAGTLPRRLAAALVMGLLPAALLWPALSNRFPLIFYDTGGYLARPFEQTLEIGRSALYGAFLAA